MFSLPIPEPPKRRPLYVLGADELPPYRFVPESGLPHPTMDPAGHWAGRERVKVAADVSEKAWMVHRPWLEGVDYFNHFHFWEAGWPALHFGAFPPPPDYHKTTDTLAVVDIDFLAEVTRVITALSAAQAGPLAPPDPPPESGCACSSGPVSSPPGSLVLAAALAWVLRRRRQCG